jgi:osmotically-inducible protein OsmY
MNNESIVERVRDVLADIAQVNSEAISVTVGYGRATLYGRVRDSSESEAAELTASLTPGVSAVRNLLQVDPEGQKEDLRRHHQLMKALEGDDGIDAFGVRVSVSGPQAVLWGTVRSQEQKRAVERLAKFNHGAMYIRNDLEVRPAE